MAVIINHNNNKANPKVGFIVSVSIILVTATTRVRVC